MTRHIIPKNSHLTPCSPGTKFSRQRDALRSLERIASLQLLPALDTAGLNANHVLPAILGGEILGGGRLVDPGVPYDDLVEVVADDAEDRLAGAGDDDGVLGALGRGVNAVGLAGESNGTRLRHDSLVGEFVNVLRVLEARNIGRRDVLRFSGLVFACKWHMCLGESLDIHRS